MIKKKFLVALSTLLGASTFVGLISAGYIANNYDDNAYQYAAIPQSSSTSDLIQTYFSSSVNGSKLLYLASYIHTTPLTNALSISKSSNEQINKYIGKTGFVLIDDQFGLPKFDQSSNLFLSNEDQPIWSTNVSAVQFRTDLGSFITGITLAEFLNENQSYFLDDGKLTWSTYGALPYSSITSFMGGMQKGIKWFNENIVPKKSDYKEVEQVFVGPNYSQNFAGSFDVTAGNGIVNELLAKNVDAIFPVAGAQVSQVVRLIKQLNKKTIVVGVDSAVETNTSTNLSLPTSGTNIGYQNKIIQFSSTKNISNIVEKITTIIDNPSVTENTTNSDEWSDIGGIGYSSLGTVKNGGVGVSDTGKPYFIKAMNIFSDNNSEINFDELTSDQLSTLYNEASNSLSTQADFIALNNSDNKTYSISSNGDNYSYADIVNNGFDMLPIAGTSEEIATWYDNQYSSSSSMMENKEQNLALINEWIQNNIEDINVRKNVKSSLVTSLDNNNNGLNKTAWENYHGVIKIVFQDPASILFDSSFLESCYYGLKAYWMNNYEVKIPDPPNTSK